VLGARANSLDSVLVEHLRVYLDRLELIFLVSGAQHIVVAHAPRVNLICRLIKSIDVVAAGEDLVNLLANKAFNEIRSLKVVDAVQIGLLLCLHLSFLGLDSWLALRDLLAVLLFLFDLDGRLSGLLGFLSFFHFLLCFHCSVLSIEVADTALALIVPTPGIDFTLFSDGDGVMFSASDRLDMHVLQVLHECGHACVGLGANSELAVVVQTPGVQLSLLVEIKGGMVPAKNIYGISGANRLDFHGLSISASRSQISSDFATFSVSPGKYLAVGGQSERVMCSRDNSVKSTFALHKHIHSKLGRLLQWVACTATHRVSIEAR